METPNTYWDLFLGYSVIWFLIAFFIYRLVREQSRISKTINEIRESANSSSFESEKKAS